MIYVCLQRYNTMHNITCVFHFIEFPDEEMMIQIVKVHFPNLDSQLLKAALKKFYQIRSQSKLRKLPSTSELIDWLHALLAMGMDAKTLNNETPLIGCLLKNEQDLNPQQGSIRSRAISHF